MEQFTKLWSTLLLLSIISVSREYQYNIPQRPFVGLIGPQTQLGRQQEQARYAVVRTLGPDAKNYDIFMTKSTPTYEAHQQYYNTPAAAYLTPEQSQHPQQTQQSQHLQHTQQSQHPQQQSQQAQQSQHPQQQSQQAQQSQHLQHTQLSQHSQHSQQIQQLQHSQHSQHSHHSQHSQQTHSQSASTSASSAAYASSAHAQGNSIGGTNLAYSVNANPLLKQLQSQFPYPASGQSDASFARALSQAAAAYSGPHTNSIGATTAGQGNLALATNNQLSGSATGSQIPGKIGDYVSQSEPGQLAYYPQHQLNGDVRPFDRFVTTCYPNGQCDRRPVAAGQPAPQLQQTIMATRARVSFVSDKCRRIAEAQKAAGGGASLGPNSVQVASPKRPRDRRLFAYSEVVLARDPHN